MKKAKAYDRGGQWTGYLLCAAGACVYALGLNLFVSPMGFYANGVMGLSQIAQAVLTDRLHISLGGVSISAALYLLLNLFLFILAVRSIGKRFLIKTGLGVVLISVLIDLIPIPKAPIINEQLTCAVIGGIACGTGTGLCLRAGGSTGGTDILGMYFAKKSHEFSVGKLNLLINAVIYVICILLFDVSVAIYCIIYAVFSSMMVDRVHTQSINVEALIFTKTDGEEIRKRIISELNRSATLWRATGGYTGTDTEVIYAVLSKYEAAILRRIVKDVDDKAFVTFREGCHIAGNFKKHL